MRGHRGVPCTGVGVPTVTAATSEHGTLTMYIVQSTEYTITVGRAVIGGSNSDIGEMD